MTTLKAQRHLDWVWAQDSEGSEVVVDERDREEIGST